jgi:hypothetical protein
MWQLSIIPLSLITLTASGSLLLASESSSQDDQKTASNQEQKQTTFVQPDYSGEAPIGRARGTGTRGGGCEQLANLEMIPLLPADGRGLTKSESPKVWFYVNYGEENLSPNSTLNAEFALEEIKTYQGTRLDVSLPKQSGVFAVEIPESLDPNQWHRWYLSLDCSGSQNQDTAFAVWEGLVKRVPTDSSSKENYAQQGIWYDALAEAAQNKCQNPTAWNSLLSQVGLTDVAKQTESYCAELK